jgi:hypothetical protein
MKREKIKLYLPKVGIEIKNTLPRQLFSGFSFIRCLISFYTFILF